VPLSALRAAVAFLAIPSQEIDSAPAAWPTLAIRRTSAQTAAMPSAPRWQAERPDIRASDAERERVVSFLRDKTAEGRLTADELDERVGRAYAAVTRGELHRLVRDLPDPPVRRRVERYRRPDERSRRRLHGIAVIGIAGLVAMRLPGLALVLVWTAVAFTIALVALIAVLAVTLGPLIALVVLAVVALRRRHGRCGALRLR
jgi:Domain of unknown function (DUF1707)